MNNRNIFQKFLFVKSKPVSTCWDESDDLSRDELKMVSSAQIALLHRTSSGTKLKQEKKGMDQDRILTYFRVNGTLTT